MIDEICQNMKFTPPCTTKHLAKIKVHVTFTLLLLCNLKTFFEQTKLQLLKERPIFFTLTGCTNNKVHNWP